MTEKLRIVVGSDNVFRDLGVPEAEAQNLLLRGNLVIHIRKVIDKLGITQAEAAKRAGITQPRMNDLVKNRTHKFTLDALVNVAAQLGYSVKLTLKKMAHDARQAAKIAAMRVEINLCIVTPPAYHQIF